MSSWNMFLNPLYLHLRASAFPSMWEGTSCMVGTAERCPVAVQLQATFMNYRSMYMVFSLLALMIVVMTGVIPHMVPPHWQINEPVFIVPISFLVGGHLLAPLVSHILLLFALGRRRQIRWPSARSGVAGCASSEVGCVPYAQVLNPSIMRVKF